MRRSLPLTVLTVAAFSGCSSVDLKPITKPSNPRVIERELIAPRLPVQRPTARAGDVVGGNTSVDETADLPVMPSASQSAVTQKSNAVSSMLPKPSGAASIPAAGGKVVASVAPAKGGAKNAAEASKEKVWYVKASDVRLATTFEHWAKESTERGMPYTVLWDAGKHVLIEAQTEYHGTMLDAVKQALESPSILQSEYPLEACEYPNTPPVIRVTRQGEQAKDCPDYR